jgi:hypothetical protein
MPDGEAIEEVKRDGRNGQIDCPIVGFDDAKLAFSLVENAGNNARGGGGVNWNDLHAQRQTGPESNDPVGRVFTPKQYPVTGTDGDLGKVV